MPNPSEIERCCPDHFLAPDCDCMRGRGKLVQGDMNVAPRDEEDLEDARDREGVYGEEASNETA